MKAETDQIFEMIGKCVNQHVPDEAPIYAEYGKNLINARLASKKLRDDPSTFGFGPEVMEAGLLIMKIVAGTIEVINFYHSHKDLRHEREDKKKLRDSWVKFLINEGVPPSLANLMPDPRIDDLIQILGQRTEN